jgi:hypothetical protein
MYFKTADIAGPGSSFRTQALRAIYSANRQRGRFAPADVGAQTMGR